MGTMLRRAMVYLGLVDDEYDEYEAYEEMQPAPVGAQQQRSPRQMSQAPQTPMVDVTDTATVSSIRTLSRDPRHEEMPTVSPRPAVVRPIASSQATRVHVVEPVSFSDAQEIGERLKSNQPVIVTLQAVSPELSRRLIDFCSGATYTADGTMERVAKNVFLLTPSNVEVSAEERRRLQERGYRS